MIVSIKDTGIGIPPEMLLNVFQRFMQVDGSLEKSQGGLGIGLSLVKTLVELHRGSVTAHIKGHGHGSEFVVRLPITLNPTVPEQRSEMNAPKPTSARRILVVDDNRDAAISLAMLLRISGHTTHTAHDGEEAVTAAGTFRPEVILLDIGLPKLNGFEVARAIRDCDWGKTTMIVALTGWGQEDDRQKSTDAGFDAHLVKPVDFEALKKLLA